MTKLDHEREQWEREFQERGRNIVFPDTVNNERRFWNHVVSGKQRLTAIQIVGLCLIAVTLFATFGITFHSEWSIYRGTGESFWIHLMRAYGGYILPITLLAAFLLALKLFTRRSKRHYH